MNDLWAWREIHGPTPCVGHLDSFFHHDGLVGHSPARTLAEHAARNICRTCPVIRLCFDASIVTLDGRQYVEPGIWAGLTQTERCDRTGLPPVPGTGTKYAGKLARRTRNAQ